MTNTNLNNVKEIEKAIDDIRNPYISYYRDIINEKSIKKYDIVCFSLFHPDQIIPLFLLAKYLKSLNKGLHIHVFGMYEDQINTTLMFSNTKYLKSKLSNYFDSIGLIDVCFYLDKLIKDIRKSKNIPYYIDESYGFISSKFTYNLTKNVIKQIPQSDFMPGQIINILYSKGCYWSKCKFCSIKEHSNYYVGNIKHIINIMKLYSNNNNVILRFRDCCLSPNILIQLADIILEQNIKITWCCRARLEQTFTDSYFSKLSKAGCIMMSFGVESTVNRINTLIGKGVNYENLQRITILCKKYGIATKLTAIINFPTETPEEALVNIQRLTDISVNCLDIKLNDFILFDNTWISNHMDDYSLVEMVENSDFHIYKASKNKNFELQERTKKVYEKYYDFFDNKAGFLSEEHMLLYLKKFGLNKLLKWKEGK